jgi:hypothetical protein
MNKPAKIVHITWVDSQVDLGWKRVDPKITLLCESVGYLVEKTKDRVIIATNFAHGDVVSYGQHTHIPTCSIKKIRTVRT